MAPEGTVFPLAPGDYSVTAGATKVSSLIYGNPSIAGGGSVVSVTVSTAVGAGQALTLAVTAVTNPGTGPSALTVETSSDTQAVSTPSYPAGGGHGGGGPDREPVFSPALASGVTWKVDFTTGARGALPATHGVIMFAAPAGTVLSPRASDYFVSTGGTAGAYVYNVQLLGAGSIADVTAPSDIPANSSISVVASSVTNPPAGSLSLDVSTSSQPVGASSTIRLVGTAGQLSATTQFSARLSNTEGGAALVTYTLHLGHQCTRRVEGTGNRRASPGSDNNYRSGGHQVRPVHLGMRGTRLRDRRPERSERRALRRSLNGGPACAGGHRGSSTGDCHALRRHQHDHPGPHSHVGLDHCRRRSRRREVHGDRPERGKASFGEPLQHDQGSGLGGLHAEVPHRTRGRVSRFRY